MNGNINTKVVSKASPPAGGGGLEGAGIHRFPEDFMFQLNEKEANTLVSQFVIPSKKYLGGALPFAFTEQGVAMLSSVLNSERAIEVNTIIIRTFVLIRQSALQFKELYAKLLSLEKKYNKNLKKFIML